MKTFVRYIASGGAFVVVLGLLKGDHFRFVSIETKPGQYELSAFLVSLLVVVAGVAIYVIHRAGPYRLLKRLVVRLLNRQGNESDRQIEQRLTDARIERRGSGPDALQDHFDNFGSEVHFLYCTAWGICFAIVCNIIHGAKWDRDCLAAIVAAVFLVACAFWHDFEMTEQEIAHLPTNRVRDVANHGS